MQKGIIGKKVGMTQVFDEKGNVVPVTVIEAGPCVVVQKKTAETDGYAAVQLGFGDVSPKRVNKPLKGHFDKADVAPKKTLREFRFDNCDAFNVGDIVKADTFAPGERVDVCGTSKGKGYAGAIKRWNFHRLKESHGTGPVARHAGSLGACSSPSRVFKGMKAAGHLGAERVTVQNLDVVKVDAENNLIAVRGAIPGPRGGVVLLVSTFDMTGKQTGSMELSDAIFGIEPNAAVLHSVVVNYLANQRQGTQSTLTRAEVSGGGRKPWRQKGTGHARQGSIRAPQWTHGGISHGPKPRSYSYTLPKKIRRLAMKSAFSSKVAAGEMLVLDGLAFEEIKTKTAAKMLSALEATGKVLLVMPEKDEKAILSMRNIPGVKTALVNTLNVYDILNCDKFIVVKDAVGKIEEVYK